MICWGVINVPVGQAYVGLKNEGQSQHWQTPRCSEEVA